MSMADRRDPSDGLSSEHLSGTIKLSGARNSRPAGSACQFTQAGASFYPIRVSLGERVFSSAFPSPDGCPVAQPAADSPQHSPTPRPGALNQRSNHWRAASRARSHRPRRGCEGRNMHYRSGSSFSTRKSRSKSPIREERCRRQRALTARPYEHNGQPSTSPGFAGAPACPPARALLVFGYLPASITSRRR